MKLSFIERELIFRSFCQNALGVQEILRLLEDEDIGPRCKRPLIKFLRCNFLNRSQVISHL